MPLPVTLPVTLHVMRCDCCGARSFGQTDRRLRTQDGIMLAFTHACTHCGLLVAAGGERPGAIAAQIAAAVAQRDFQLPAFDPDEMRWGMDIYTLRTAATRSLRRTTPMGEAQVNALKAPHGSLVARAMLDDLPSKTAPDLAIAVLCREGDLDKCREQARAWVMRALDVLIIVDAEPSRWLAETPHVGPGGGRLRITRRPLANDFAGQRNFAQASASRSWVLQLDADETVNDSLVGSLGGLIGMAERDGVISVGFPRRNLVDGVLSDLYPDVQYRLNHTSVRFAGAVHERPILPEGWRQSFIALSGAIDHHLSAAHVAERSLRYEALSPGRGRLEEAQLLMQPYRS